MSGKQEITVKGPSLGLSTLLAVLFIGLKLTGYITWSWLWVLAPLWIPWVIFFGVLLFVFIIAMLK